MPNSELKIVLTGLLAATAYLILQCPCTHLLACENKLFLGLWGSVLILVEYFGQFRNVPISLS